MDRRSFQRRSLRQDCEFQFVSSRNEYFQEVHRVLVVQAISPRKNRYPSHRKIANPWAQSEQSAVQVDWMRPVPLQ